MWMAAILAAILNKVCRKLISWITFLYIFISITGCPESSEHIAVSYISEQCPPVANNGRTYIYVIGRQQLGAQSRIYTWLAGSVLKMRWPVCLNVMGLPFWARGSVMMINQRRRSTRDLPPLYSVGYPPLL
jgi:hypothetical protein